MRLDTLLRPELVRCGLAARDKEAALREVVSLVPPAVPGLTADDLLAALTERERLGPFSMSKGVAFPHARIEKAPALTIAVGTCPRGIDFRAPDGLPARAVVLFAIPRKHSDLYLQAMATFLTFFGRPGNLERVVCAATPRELVSAFEPAAP